MVLESLFLPFKTIKMQSSILLELQYLGSIQYYSKFLSFDSICIEQHENYRKGSFRNRCIIASANGTIPLSIPLLKGKHQQTGIRSVAIDNKSNWQLMHWRSIQTAYGNSPYFDYYKDDFNVFYEKKYDLLFQFCRDVHELILELLQIKPPYSFTHKFERTTTENTVDFRSKILPKNYQTQLDNNFVAKSYPQVFEDRLGFLANLSILDLLFCLGPEAAGHLKNCLL